MVFNSGFVFLTLISLVLAFDYCEYGSDHTMCQYTGEGCTITKRVFSDADKVEAVNVHNELRQNVASGGQSGQPTASNMLEVKWDDELATIAQSWADQCTFGHDKNRRSQVYDYVGQNAYISWTSWDVDTVNIRAAANSWYNEVTDPGFSSDNIKPFKYTSGTGHYTQMVWAKTKAIGCGVSMYKDRDMYTQLIICNYGPGGNIIDGSMYDTGAACSGCSTCSTDYNALCSRFYN